MRQWLPFALFLSIGLLLFFGCENAGNMAEKPEEIDTTPPSEVSNLSAVSGEGKVILSWTKPQDDDFDHVTITFGSGGTVGSSFTGTISATGTEINGLTNGVEYSFVVTAVDSVGNKSDGKTVTGIPCDVTAPGEVSDLRAETADGTVTLTWTNPPESDFAGCEIWYGTDGKPDTEFSGTVDPTGTTITGLVNDTEYTFAVYAIDIAQNSSSGRTITATPTAPLSYTLSGNWISANENDAFHLVAASSQESALPLVEMEERNYPDTFTDTQTDQVIIKYKSGIVRTRSLSSKVELYGRETVAINKSDYTMSVVEIGQTNSSIEEVVTYYNSLPEIEYAEPDYIVRAYAGVDDPYYSYQWNLDQLNMPAVWDDTTGSITITVAVIDTGIANNISDLSGTSFTSGYDFVNDDDDPYDDNRHGTHVAGTIAQTTNNGEGVAGMAYGVTLMAIKVLGQDGSGYVSDIVEGIRWAADNGADIINLSLGSSSYTQTEYDACKYAYEKGVALFAAAGNENGAVGYPAAHNEYVIAVGATDYDKERAPYSNYGPSLDIVAPGGNVNEDGNSDGYGDGILQQTIAGDDDEPATGYYDTDYYFFQGTSMACPHASALAALLKSKDNTVTNAELYDTILDSAEDLGANGRDDYFGYGLLNPAAALSVGINSYPITDTVNRAYYDKAIEEEWRIQADSGSITLDLEFNHSQNNLDLFLYDETGTRVAQSETVTDNESVDYYVGSNGGLFTIRVSGTER